MARGDSASAMSSITAGGNYVFQPGSGVEILLQRVAMQAAIGSAPNAVPDVEITVYDGSNDATWVSSSPENEAALLRAPITMHLTNSIYVRLNNRDGSTHYIAAMGTVTKG